MAVMFDVGGGTTVNVNDNAHMMDTQRGFIAADTVVAGDEIRNIAGEPRLLVVAPPVVS